MAGALAIAVLAGLTPGCSRDRRPWVLPFALAVVVTVFDLIPRDQTLPARDHGHFWSASVVADHRHGLFDGFFVVYQQVENYLIYPTVMRRSVKVSDVAAVVAALLGVALFRVMVQSCAIPMVAAIQLIVREVVVPQPGSPIAATVATRWLLTRLSAARWDRSTTRRASSRCRAGDGSVRGPSIGHATTCATPGRYPACSPRAPVGLGARPRRRSTRRPAAVEHLRCPCARARRSAPDAELPKSAARRLQRGLTTSSLRVRRATLNAT